MILNYCIYGKMTQILETLFILVDNAHDAIEEKRRFLDRQENPEPFEPHISIQLVQEENLSHIEITDNGIGIREEDRNKVFAPYFTTKSSYNESSGSGIGLYEVSRFVNEHHRGRIWFTSEYMKGTTFNIELPRHPAEGEAAV